MVVVIVPVEGEGEVVVSWQVLRARGGGYLILGGRGIVTHALCDKV